MFLEKESVDVMGMIQESTVKDIAISEGGLGFDSGADHIRYDVATASTFRRSCVARGDHPDTPYSLRRNTAGAMKI